MTQYPPPPSSQFPPLYADPNAPRRANGPAIASLILGILGCVPIITGIFAIILGIVGIQKSSRDSSVRGKGMAVAGLVLGILSLIGWAASVSLFYTLKPLASPRQFGIDDNPNRAALKIPALPPNWRMSAYFPGQSIQWSNPNGWGPPPKGHLTKQINLSSTGQRLSETDAYYTGKGSKSLDPDAGSPDYEILRFTYSYAAQKQDPWTCEIETAETRKISFQEGEDILKQRGIDRLGN